ncbi:MAG: DUF2723 domain-containing protein [candidate division WOR-3 bacterium]
MSENKIYSSIQDFKNHLQLVLFLGIVFLIYLYSLCPTLYLIDSGELATVSYTLGIAHPTGYPLYTLISYFFAHLPGEPIRNLNFLSALVSVIAAFLLFLTLKKIINHPISNLTITTLFAFSPIIWRISITNEVYILTALMGVLILYLFYQLKNSRLFYGITFFAGLSFTNHFMIFAIAFPLLIYLLIIHRPRLKVLFSGAAFFLLGFSLYLYLLIRTQAGADIAWGNPCDLQRLLWHITGRQYRVWMFSLTGGEILTNAKNGLLFLLRNLFYIFSLPLVLGLFYLFHYDRKRFYLFLTIVGLNFFYAINYAIPDIESYYIPGFIVTILICAYGLNYLKRFIRWFIALPVGLLIGIINYPECTLKNNTFGYDYGYAHLAPLPPNSLLICSYWDIYSPTIYLRKIKNIRRDLVVIDKELLRRTWYLKYLAREYPDFYQAAEKEINEYLHELYKFEYGKPYQPAIIQSKFIRMLERFVEVKESLGVYFALPFPDRDLNAVKPAYYRIPFGLNYLITKTPQIPHFDFSQLKISQPKFVNDPRLKYNIETVVKMASNNIHYLTQNKRWAEAQEVKAWLEENFLRFSTVKPLDKL